MSRTTRLRARHYDGGSSNGPSLTQATGVANETDHQPPTADSPSFAAMDEDSGRSPLAADGDVSRDVFALPLASGVGADETIGDDDDRSHHSNSSDDFDESWRLQQMSDASPGHPELGDSLLSRPYINLSPTEEGMLELVRLCDSSGAPRGLYDNIVTLLRRRGLAGFDPTKAYSRARLVAKLSDQVSVPSPLREVVRGVSVFRFPFLGMLKDLLSSPIFDHPENLCVNQDPATRFSPFVPPPDSNDDMEIMCRNWATASIRAIPNFVDGEDFFFPISIYGDKTGTDRMQRYPLEPWMWTTALLRRHVREDAGMWRHLGFVPSLDVKNIDEDDSISNNTDSVDSHDGAGAAGEQNDHCKSVSQESLQKYHDCLYCLLTEIRESAVVIPSVEINLGGMKRTVRLHVRVATILGDQLSQDYLCGRVSNNTTSAGRVHRACMRSAASASDARDGSCGDLMDPKVANELQKYATQATDVIHSKIAACICTESNADRKEMARLREFVSNQVKLATAILGKPFCLHPLRNGFRGVHFGINEHGVVMATVEDHLHSMEAGVIMYLNLVVYLGFTDTLGKLFDEVLRDIQAGSRSSVSSRFPKSMIKKNFHSQSLMTHTEKVGSLFNILLGLHTPAGRDLFIESQRRQLLKYNNFPTTCGDGEGSEETGEEESPDDSAIQPPTRKRSAAALRKEIISDHPHRNDSLFATDRKDALPFDRSDDSISFVMEELRRHGFSNVLRVDCLDEIQVDQLLVGAWKELKSLKGKPDIERYPSKSTIDKILSKDPSLSYIFSSIYAEKPTRKSPLEQSCLGKLRREPEELADSGLDATMSYHHSFPIKSCTEKHRRKRKKVKGTGRTSAVLCPVDQFVYFVEYVLCYHAWCHDGYKLRKELRDDVDLIDYGCRLVVRYFDTYLYRGDDSVDSDFCKLHSQLHCARIYAAFGDWMQHNTALGERGLKTWAKWYARTARKRGSEMFHFDTTSRIWEQMLFRKVWDSIQGSENPAPNPPPQNTATPAVVPPAMVEVGRKQCHFVYKRSDAESQDWTLIALDRSGNRVKKTPPPSAMIDPSLLKLLTDIDEGKGITEYRFWTEAKLPNGDMARCWPQYRQNDGPYYDWVMAQFDTVGGPGDANLHPAKLLAFFTDGSPGLKALVHSVEEKMASKKESKYGDSQLLTHYRRQFIPTGPRGRRQATPKLYQLRADSVKRTALAYEAIPNKTSPLPVPFPFAKKSEHTVSVVRPRSDWAELYLDWTKVLKERHENESGNKRYELRP